MHASTLLQRLEAIFARSPSKVTKPLCKTLIEQEVADQWLLETREQWMSHAKVHITIRFPLTHSASSKCRARLLDQQMTFLSFSKHASLCFVVLIKQAMHLTDNDLPVLQFWTQGLGRAQRMHLLISQDAEEE